MRGAAGERELEIAVSPAGVVRGDLVVPDPVSAIVVFAHGSGSSRHSSRNRQVARALQARGFATFLVDLLTAAEAVVDERTAEHRFDVDRLARRVERALDELGGDATVSQLPVGLFGASTGAAAALVAAARRPDAVRAVVSRGGRPDLAGRHLVHVAAPTLLIVGGRDDVVLALNRQAAAQLRAPHELVVVPGATHLFPEPGALEEVARLAGDWFARHVTGATSHDAR